MAEIGLFKVVISERVLEECERNLRRKLLTSLPIFQKILIAINPEIVSQPSISEVVKWAAIIDPKDAPILTAALQVNVNRLLTLNTKHFTPDVSVQSRLIIQTPSQFIQEVRSIITQGLS